MVIDDYGTWEGAKDATDEYRAAQGIDAPLVEIDHHGGLLAEAARRLMLVKPREPLPTVKTSAGARPRSPGRCRLRPAVAQVTAHEGRLLEGCAAGAGSIVEIGIAEGGSAWHLRRAIAPHGTITLIDTYPRCSG